MSQSVRDVMTPDPITIKETASLADAARLMRDNDIGPLLVMGNGGGTIRGIVTDRDIVIRAIAEGRNPRETMVSEVCTDELVMASPDDDVEEALALVRNRAIRRLPVVEDGHAVGILSLGDLALERDPRSVLAEVSAAPPTR